MFPQSNLPPAVAGGANVLPWLAPERKAPPPLLEIASSSDLEELVLVVVVVVVVVEMEEEAEHRSARRLSIISDAVTTALQKPA